MATIQAKTSRGHKYWYIIESQRVNGKPRPIVLAYLGKPEDLLKRLQGLCGHGKLKSYSHGGVCALLEVARRLDVATIINRYVKSSRSYRATKPIKNHLTVGMTIVLAAVGRACMPTSKNQWASWAQTTSCGYLLRRNLSKLDSQHFWDMMDAVPVEAVELIEQQLLKKAFELYKLDSDTLFFDTTNFFTFIDSANQCCTIAQRGKNKQKRHDLRQVGMAMVVTREDMIPLFHVSYKGNLHDTKISAGIKMRTGFNGTMDTLLDSLNDIRLAAVLAQSDSPGPAKASYQLEQMSETQQQLMHALGIEDNHIRRPRFNGVGVYKDR